jgi:aspartate racemase
MAADYVREMKMVQPKGPYFLAGYSFGGIAVFEMAQQLQARGDEVALLLLMDPSPPAGIETTSPSRFEGLQRRLRYHLRSVRGMTFWQQFTKLKTLLMSKIKDIIYGAVCRVYLRLDRQLPPFVRTFYFLDAARQASRRYKPKVYPGRIVLLVAEKSLFDTRSIWSRLASDGVETHMLPGDHMSIAIEPQARTWAQRLRECLQAAQINTNRGHGVQAEPAPRAQAEEA